jgi:hypothetical protein
MASKTRRTSSTDPAQGTTRRSRTPPARRHTRTARLAIAALAACAIASFAIYLALPDDHPQGPPKPASTVADNKNACLLADADQSQTPTVFADLQQAAATLGDVNARQTTLPPQADDAAPELAGLVQQHCNVIYTLGPLSTSAAKAAATDNQGTTATIIAITDSAIPGAHLATLPLAHITASQVATSLTTALRQ